MYSPKKNTPYNFNSNRNASRKQEHEETPIRLFADKENEFFTNDEDTISLSGEIKLYDDQKQVKSRSNSIKDRSKNKSKEKDISKEKLKLVNLFSKASYSDPLNTKRNLYKPSPRVDLNKLTNFKKGIVRDKSNDKSKETLNTEINNMDKLLTTNRMGQGSLRKSIEMNRVIKEKLSNNRIGFSKHISNNKGLKINTTENVKTNEC